MPRRTPLSTPESDPRACSAGARVNALGRVSFFEGLDHDALHRLDGRADMQAMDAEQAVYLAGQPAERLYVIATGAVKLTAVTAEGTDVLLDVLGSFLGTLPALGGVTHTEHAWALTAGCLLSFTADSFDAVLDEHPRVARNALAAMGTRLHDARERIELTAAANAPVRIAMTLLVLAERLGVDEGDRILIDVPLSREDLASLAGCAPATISRNLATWGRDGIIDSGRRWVALRQPGVLAELAGTTTVLATPPRNSAAPT